MIQVALLMRALYSYYSFSVYSLAAWSAGTIRAVGLFDARFNLLAVVKLKLASF
jgi:hypothetical protein